MLLYYITDRTRFPGGESARQSALLQKIAEAARAGVDFIQLREKDLPARQAEALAGEVLRVIRENSAVTAAGVPSCRLLINSRTDVALACGADGVHLPANDISPAEVRDVWRRGQKVPPIITVSCHNLADVAGAASQGADFAIFAPVFEKRGSPAVQPSGISGLREACRHKLPVLALGGVTLENVPRCLQAGAAGIAAIRLFQENDVAEVVRALRG